MITLSRKEFWVLAIGFAACGAAFYLILSKTLIGDSTQETNGQIQAFREAQTRRDSIIRAQSLKIDSMARQREKLEFKRDSLQGELKESFKRIEELTRVEVTPKDIEEALKFIEDHEEQN